MIARPHRGDAFEDDVLAIVGARRQAGLFRSTAGSVGAGLAIVLAGLGAGLITGDHDASQSAPVMPGSARPLPPISMAAEPSASVDEPSRSDGLRPQAARPIVATVPQLVHTAAASHGVRVGREHVPAAGSTVAAAFRRAHADPEIGTEGAGPVVDDNAGSTDEIGGKTDQQERSNDTTSRARRADIAARDALRDLRLR